MTASPALTLAEHAAALADEADRLRAEIRLRRQLLLVDVGDAVATIAELERRLAEVEAERRDAARASKDARRMER